MTALDELRKLDDAARLGAVGTPTARQVIEARAKLAALSHLLRPMAEALEEAGECCGGRHGVREVLAQLEEALK